MTIEPTQHNLDILLTWKQMLEDLLKDHSLLGWGGLCFYLEDGKGVRTVYLKVKDEDEDEVELKSSYFYINNFMTTNIIPGYMDDSDLGTMSPRRITLAERLLVKINSDINQIQCELDPS